MFAPAERPRCEVCNVIILVPRVFTPILCEQCLVVKAKA